MTKDILKVVEVVGVLFLVFMLSHSVVTLVFG